VLSQFPGVPLSIFGGAGNDSINVGVTAGSGYQNLTIDGGGGVNTLGVYDQSGGGIARRETLADGSDEIDMSYGGSILSRIRDQDIQAVLSNVLARTSMTEMAYSREHHRQAVLVACLDRILIAQRPAGLHDRGDAGASGLVNVVAEG